jgi:hypothetical protein
VVRLWLESLNMRRQQFHMCNVIPSGTDSVVGWLASLTEHEVPTSDPFAPVETEENPMDDGYAEMSDKKEIDKTIET